MEPRTITLDKFQPRDYQLPVFEALEKHGYKKLVVIWPRRSGKDMVGFNLIIRAAHRRVGTYYYVFPTFSAGRRILWDAIDSSSNRVLDYLPKELVESRHEQQMRIKLRNGSLIQIIGSDNFDNTLIGTNPVGMIFSEYALQDEQAYAFSKPILAANNGWCCFLSTPRTKNHLWTLWNIAIANPKIWFSNMLTVKETGHISEEEIQADIERGEISWDIAQQEYYCSFDVGVAGGVYTTTIDRMKLNNQVSNVPWLPQHRVNTAWDIGNDMTCIVFFQVVGLVVHVIDYYQNSGEQLEHYVNIINAKQYTYGRHYFPFDMRITEWGGKKYTRVEKARQLGIKADIVESVGLDDGIEFTKSSMAKIWIDETKCKQLLDALGNYRYEYDKRLARYKDKPLHDKWSHGSDAFRYMCLSLPKSKDSMTQEDVNRLKQEALYSDSMTLSPVFQQPKYSGHNQGW